MLLVPFCVPVVSTSPGDIAEIASQGPLVAVQLPAGQQRTAQMLQANQTDIYDRLARVLAYDQPDGLALHGVRKSLLTYGRRDIYNFTFFHESERTR